MDAPSKADLKQRRRTRRCIPSELKRFNSMDAPSKQGVKQRRRTQRCIPSELKRFSGGACPRTPLEFFGHFSRFPDLPEISHSLETWRLHRYVFIPASRSKQSESMARLEPSVYRNKA